MNMIMHEAISQLGVEPDQNIITQHGAKMLTVKLASKKLYFLHLIALMEIYR